ncbi:methyl-accepting chemotaxis protein [Natrinema salifodinae]|uniref:Methyl-accepting chemotaxis protein n=1 Tax=Natrinema salifodinae TaxID=1202768 RepID=A0A1I0QLF3_9EURY|nr:methyl-accepting chemotaxis protein [Natrinema salifodinae]SEW28066.1 Methyl-accepting chemotaxis protein [Natrinema salifodinae]
MALEDYIPDRLRETYSVKIGLLFLVVAVMSILVTGLFFGHVTGSVGPEAEGHFSDRTDDRSDVAGAWLETNAETASGLATDAVVQEGESGAVGERLAAVQSARSDRVAEIHYLDGDGSVLASSDDAAVGENFFATAGIEGATDGPSSPHQGLTTDDSVLSFVADVDGEQRYVAVSAPVDAFASILETGGDGDGSARTVVTDADGEPIAAVGHEASVGDDAVLAAIPTAGDGVATGVPEGTDTEFAATAATIDAGGEPLTVTTYDTATAVYGPQLTATSSLLALLMVFVLHLGLVGVVMGGNVSLNLRQLGNKAERMGNGDLAVDFETNRVDEVGVLYGSFASMRDSLRETLTDLESQRERAREAQQRTERRNHELETEAERYSEVMAACADGDLEQRLEPKTDHDAMVSIAEAFNEMIADLEDAIAQVTEISADVAQTSTEVQSSSDEIRRASQEVSTSVQEISDGSASQAEDLSMATTEVKEMSATVEEVAAATSTIAEQSSAVDELATDGQRAAAETTAEMHAASERTEAVAETVRSLDDEAEQIQQVVELIDEIAAQTNMLALNAAIESARSESASSESGGFQAVADEVKELAEQTQAAVEDIERMIESIQGRAATSAVQIEEAETTIGTATEQVDDLSAKLDRIATEIEQVAAGVEEIDQATDEQADSAEELATIVQDVASVADETTSQAQQVAAAAEETTATISDVSAEATRLDERAADLADAVDEFSVSTGTEPEADPAAAPAGTDQGGESR